MVSLDYPPTVGGITAHVYELSQALKNIGCEVINYDIDRKSLNPFSEKKSIDNIINGQNSNYYSSLSEKISRGIIQLNEQTEVVLDNVRDQTASSEESLAALEEISSTAQHMNQNIILTAKSFEKSLEISKNSTKSTFSFCSSNIFSNASACFLFLGNPSNTTPFESLN